MIKSEEELDWLAHRRGAVATRGWRRCCAGTKPGLTERELGAIVESAYIRHGGTTMIHYIGVTSMAKPHIYVPPQHHSPRKVKKGDVVFCELSAFWWDYAGPGAAHVHRGRRRRRRSTATCTRRRKRRSTR